MSIQFLGSPGSPYTRKMLALLRYRHINYQFLIGDQAAHLPKPPINLLPTFYLPNEAGALEAVIDSSRILRRLEVDYTSRSVIPENPVMAFINEFIEDYGDEWLTKAMFHYRWHYSDDAEFSSRILPIWTNFAKDDVSLMSLSAVFRDRQENRLHVVGSNKVTAPLIESSYQRFLVILNKILSQRPFLLGDKPSSADFAIYAQLTQLAKFDPTPSKICINETPRVYAWVDLMDDLSGLPSDKNQLLQLSEVGVSLKPLLQEIGRTYVPVLLANAAAIAAKESTFTVELDGLEWSQGVFPYQLKCLLWLQASYRSLTSENRTNIDNIFTGTGCDKLLVN